jgi:hypothetical protein
LLFCCYCYYSHYCCCYIVFKHPIALIYLDTQYNSVKNATTPIAPSSHDMFRPQTAIFRCLSYARTVPLSTYSHHMLLRYFMI